MTTGRSLQGFRIGLSLLVVVILAFGCSTTDDLTAPDAQGSPSIGVTSANPEPTETSSAASDEPCAVAYRIPPPVIDTVAEIINVYGCGAPVHMTPEDLSQLFLGSEWGTDTGRVEETIPSVSQMSASECGVVERDTVEVIGAQVIELVGFAGTDGAFAWQDVIVLSTAADAESIWLGRIKQATCDIDVDADPQTELAAVGGDMSAGEGFSPLEPDSIRIATGDGWEILVPQRGEAVLAAWAGVYYTEVQLADQWVDIANPQLTVEAENVVDLVLRRLQEG